MTDSVLMKFETGMDLSDGERAAITSLLSCTVEFKAGQDMMEEGERPTHCLVLLQGLACRYRATPNGGRQILSFQMPGDWMELHSYILRTLDHSIRAVSACQAATIPYARIDGLLEAYPHLMKGLWRDTLIDGAVFREWVVNVGARDSRKRLAHLLCEVHRRMLSAGVATADEFYFPVTQQELGEAMGISTVHVNRSVQALKEEGLVEFKRGTVRFPQPERLRQVAEFNDAYLHIHEGPDQVSRRQPARVA
jgi:CRP-like cAMP-binding protein